MDGEKEGVHVYLCRSHSVWPLGWNLGRRLAGSGHSAVPESKGRREAGRLMKLEKGRKRPAGSRGKVMGADTGRGCDGKDRCALLFLLRNWVQSGRGRNWFRDGGGGGRL